MCIYKATAVCGLLQMILCWMSKQMCGVRTECPCHNVPDCSISRQAEYGLQFTKPKQ